jgi:DNA polymerase
MAYAMALPGSLEKAALALGIDKQKDMAGNRVMRQLAVPKANGEFWTEGEAPDKFKTLYDYCKTDVEVERELTHRLLMLSDAEQQAWELDYKINQRGIALDIKSARAALELVAKEKLILDQQMHDITNGMVNACTEVQVLGKWIREQGVEISGLTKAAVIDALADSELPDNVRTALSLRKNAAKTSTAKIVAMLDLMGPDGRLRNLHQYHGAATGRWAGRGIQPQNFPRPRKQSEDESTVEDILEHLDDRDYIDVFHGPVLDAISDILRGLLVASPGCDLLDADFANIEGRVLAWLAGEEWKVKAFSDYDLGVGSDLYILTYAKSFGEDPNTIDKKSWKRQVGKVQELAFGYQGGVGAWRTMERPFKSLLPEYSDAEVSDIKTRWRKAHAKIEAYWHALEEAAIDAVLTGAKTKAGIAGREVFFKRQGSFLWCLLPSGRTLCYPYPEIVDKDTPWGTTKPALRYMSVNGVTKKWEYTDIYGGKWAENITQAVARDLLKDAMLRLEDSGYPVVMHVHDEILCEVPESFGDISEMESIMSVLPSWAAGLPVTAEGFRAKRFKK